MPAWTLILRLPDLEGHCLCEHLLKELILGSKDMGFVVAFVVDDLGGLRILAEFEIVRAEGDEYGPELSCGGASETCLRYGGS